jgi:citrate synthase
VADVTGEHVAGLKAVREEFERTTGSEIPINVTGAIGALTADLGLEPEAARGFAIVSRAAGLLAEIIEEKDSPIAMDIWQSIDNQFDYEED